MEHLMKSYSISLGVKCNYCHIPRRDDPKKLNFSEDSKMAKEIARGMITMTDDTNEKYFKPHYPDPKPHQATDVSCVTCHRGTPNPQAYLEGVGSLFPKEESDKEE